MGGHAMSRRLSRTTRAMRLPRASSPLWLPILSACTLFTTLVSCYATLSDESLKRLTDGRQDLDVRDGALLAPLLHPRVPGTAGSTAAQQHFVEFFTTHLPAWKLTWHNTTSKTPATGDTDVPFTNIIFGRDPPWASPGDVARLTLVAHYDTLYQPEGFIGAVDSAASCAILMHVARAVDDMLTRKWEDMQHNGEAGSGLEEEKGVQILFLDGEEAWATWTEDDSLYGSRALAKSWEEEIYPTSSEHNSPLKAISLFLLLDLLGAPNPRVPSFFPSTHGAYQGMSKVEERLRQLGALCTTPPLQQGSRAFLPDTVKEKYQFHRGYIEDDHVPFLRRGIEVLHVIPYPFPKIWHTMDDDAEHLDLDAMGDWAKIVTGFVAEWMELDGFVEISGETDGKFGQGGSRDRDRDRDRDEL